MITKEQAEGLRQLAIKMQEAQHAIDRAVVVTSIMYSNLYRSRGNFLSYIDSITEGDK